MNAALSPILVTQLPNAGTHLVTSSAPVRLVLSENLTREDANGLVRVQLIPTAHSQLLVLEESVRILALYLDPAGLTRNVPSKITLHSVAVLSKLLAILKLVATSCNASIHPIAVPKRLASITSALMLVRPQRPVDPIAPANLPIIVS